MKEYMDIQELQELTGLSYQSAMKIIDMVREEMKKKGYYIPECRRKLALRWMIKKELGIK